MENKIGTVVVVDALIISFGGLFSSLNSMLILVVLLPAVISAGIGLYGIRSQPYGQPGYDIDDFHDYAEMTEPEQQEQFLLSYEVTTQRNATLNTTKFSLFNYCIGYTFFSLLLALIAPGLSRFGVVDWIIALPSSCTILLTVCILVAIILIPPVSISRTLEADRNDQ